jgi:O-antigen/teichoic acid export membrane protein
MENRGNILVKNTAILAVGNIGSRIIKFILLPLYAIFLPKEDVGLYDLIFTAVLLVEPVVTLKIVDAIYRRLVSAEARDQGLIWTGALFSLGGTSFAVVLFVLFFPSDVFSYKAEAAAFLVAKVFYTYFSEVIRGYRQNAQYAIGGVILTFATLVFSLVALFLTEDKLSSLILATGLAHFLVGLHFMWRCGFLASKPTFVAVSLSPLLVYSIPLIPSAISWWAMRLSNRFFVTAELGLEGNAMIAIAMTIPSVVVVLGQIFYMAWQESSFTNFDASDRDGYFSKVYDKYINLQFLLCTVCFLSSELVYQLFFPIDYYDSWRLSYFFFWGAVFNNLAAFLSVSYTGTYNTQGAFYTAVIGAVANVVFTWALLPLIDAWAAPLGFFIGLFCMWFARTIHTRRYFSVRIDWRSVSPAVFAFALSGFYLLVGGVPEKVAISFIALSIAIWSNAETIKETSLKLRRRIIKHD